MLICFADNAKSKPYQDKSFLLFLRFLDLAMPKIRKWHRITSPIRKIPTAHSIISVSSAFVFSEIKSSTAAIMTVHTMFISLKETVIRRKKFRVPAFLDGLLSVTVQTMHKIRKTAEIPRIM